MFGRPEPHIAPLVLRASPDWFACLPYCLGDSNVTVSQGKFIKVGQP